MRRPAAAAALAALLLAGFAAAARARTHAWRERVEGICRCGVDAVAAARRAARVMPPPLDDTLLTQARLVDASCGDLRRAVRNRSAIDALLGRPLRVVPTVEHDRASEDMRSSLRALCAPESDARWSRDPSRDDRGIVQGEAMVAAVNEARRLRAASCARRAALGARAEPYTLRETDADDAARRCGAER
ncbi:MAG: hypothetical protein R3A48_06685 [Polyangiales bacterium]